MKEQTKPVVIMKCEICGGTGYLVKQDFEKQAPKCMACNGTGQIEVVTK